MDGLSALEGIRVIETASAVAGPLAGRLLGDLGADVIHVEHPARGHLTRAQRHMIGNRLQGGRQIESDIDYMTENTNCNKRGMALDLSTKGGLEILRRMLESADVFLTNFRPRELEKFDLEYTTLSRLNPRLIMASLTGYGKNGPDKDLPGYDFNVFWARSGILHVLQKRGDIPISTPVGLGDRVTALAFAYGIAAALLARERTGLGQEVDMSLLQAAIFVNATDVGGALATGLDRQNVDRECLANALLNSYQTRDGRWLRIALNQPDRYWSRVCRAIEREDLEHDRRFNSFLPRLENHHALFEVLEEAFLSRTLDEWRVRLDEAGLPWAPILSLPEVIGDPQVRANDCFAALDHPTYGTIEIVANPVKLSRTPAAARMPAPQYGQHTEEILLEYNYTQEDVAQFREQGVIA